jgi:hypothetical protein
MVNNDVDLVCSSTDGNPGGRIAGWKRPLHVAEVQRLHIAHMSDVPRNKKEKKKKKKGKEKEMEQVASVQRLARFFKELGPA